MPTFTPDPQEAAEARKVPDTERTPEQIAAKIASDMTGCDMSHGTPAGDLAASMDTDALSGRDVLDALTAAARAGIQTAWESWEPDDYAPQAEDAPVTEEAWKAEHADAPSALEYDPPRPVIVMWHDATETPSECIMRLNAEVLEQAGRRN